MLNLLECRKPVIAAVAGAAVGIGTTMLLHCDLVYVSADARLRMPFVNLGLCPEFGSSLILPRLLGQAKAAQLLLLGEGFSGEQAAAWGIATEALGSGEAALAKAREMALRFEVVATGSGAHQQAIDESPGSRTDAQGNRRRGRIVHPAVAFAGSDCGVDRVYQPALSFR